MKSYPERSLEGKPAEGDAHPQIEDAHIPASAKPDAVGYVVLAILAALVIGGGCLVFLGGKAVVNGAKDLRAKQLAWVNRDDRSDGATSDGFRESEAVTRCDMNMQGQAASPSSYQSEWSWRIQRHEGMVAVRRGFSITNPVGVKLAGTYTCLLGSSTNEIVGLQYEVAGVVTTIPGAELRQ